MGTMVGRDKCAQAPRPGRCRWFWGCVALACLVVVACNDAGGDGDAPSDGGDVSDLASGTDTDAGDPVDAADDGNPLPDTPSDATEPDAADVQPADVRDADEVDTDGGGSDTDGGGADTDGGESDTPAETGDAASDVAADTGDDGAGDGTSDAPDAGDVATCTSADECGVSTARCDGDGLSRTAWECVGGRCASSTWTEPCGPPPADRCEGDALVQYTAICSDSACAEIEARAPCSASEVCVSGACVEAPGRPSVAFKGIQPDFHAVEEIAGNGAGHVAMNMVWAIWQPELHAPPCPEGWEAWDGACFLPDARVDDQIRAYTGRGVSVTGILFGSPAWARSGRSGCPAWAGDGTAWFCAPDDPATYARFVGYLAQRYRDPGDRGTGRIDDYVIWNEVNSDDWFSLGGWPNPGNAADRVAAHATLFWAASDAIHAVRPAARVYVSLTHLFGGDEGVHFSGYRVLDGVEAASAGRSWHVAAHPYSRAVGGTSFDAWDAPYVTFGTLHELTGYLHALRPEDPPTVYITEVGFTSSGGEDAQADALCRAFRQSLATPGVTGFIYHRYSDHPFEVAAGLALGLAADDGRQKPAWAVWALADRAAAGTGLECGFEYHPRVDVVRWRNPAGQYWVTPRDPGGRGYARETLHWLLAREEEDRTRPLYDCVVPGTEDHFVSTAAGCEGQQPMGPIGWAWTNPGPGRVPMYRCYNPAGAHFVSDDPECEAEPWRPEMLLGYGHR